MEPLARGRAGGPDIDAAGLRGRLDAGLAAMACDPGIDPGERGLVVLVDAHLHAGGALPLGVADQEIEFLQLVGREALR